jgi:hypothetical protein
VKVYSTTSAVEITDGFRAFVDLVAQA